MLKADVLNFYLTLDFVTFRLLRFDVELKRAYCRNNFLAQRPLPDMRRLSGDDFFVSTGRHLGVSKRDAVAFLERERCEKRDVV